MSCLVLNVPLETPQQYNNQRLQEIIQKPAPLNLKWSIKASSLKRTPSGPKEEAKPKNSDVNCSIRLLESVRVTEEASNLVKMVMEGLVTQEPELADEGEGGTYFLRNKSGRRIAVFKPFDEQPRAENNPKRIMSNSPLCLPEAFVGIKVEETHKNEVAAYLLDHEGFAGVPLTTLAECTHYVFSPKHKAALSGGRKRTRTLSSHAPNGNGSVVEVKEYITKVGSLQKYVDYEVQSWDMGPSNYFTREVHRIGILDIRILNLDRHGGNMLVVKNIGTPSSYNPADLDDLEDDINHEFHLVPIDHAFSLPDYSCLNGSDLWFEWFSWSQTCHPFSEETLQYIERIDIKADVDLLLAFGLRQQCLETMILTTSLLKFTALKMKMNLKQIARLIIRENPNKPSVLEQIKWYIDEEREKTLSSLKSVAGASKDLLPSQSTELSVPQTTSHLRAPAKISKSRSTNSFPPTNKSKEKSGSRSSRSPNRGNPKQGSGTAPPSQKSRKSQKTSAHHSQNLFVIEEPGRPLRSKGPKRSSEREELFDFLQVVQIVIESKLQDIVNELPKADTRIKKTSSISNELFLLQLVEEQLKIENDES